MSSCERGTYVRGATAWLIGVIVGATGVAADLPPRGPMKPVARVPESLPASAAASRPGDPVAPDTLPVALRASVGKHAALIAKVRGAAVRIVEARAVTWSDGAMGCGEPGGVYTQAQVAGYWLLVRAGQQELTYHTDNRAAFVLCADGHPPKLMRKPTHPGDPVTGPKKQPPPEM